MNSTVNVFRFWKDYEFGKNFFERGVGRGVDDQVECGTAIVLNKVGLAVEQESCCLEGLLKHLNPDATVLQAVGGNITFDQLERASSSHGPATAGEPGWIKLLRGKHALSGEAMGLRTFGYLARRRVSSRPVLDADVGKMDWGAPVERLFSGRLATQDLLHVALVDGDSRSILAVRSHRVE